MARPAPTSPKPNRTPPTTRQPDAFLLSPTKAEFPGAVLPAPLVGGPADSYVADDSLTLAEQSENGLPGGYYKYLVSGGTGQTSSTPDARITNVNSLPTGPFQLTNGSTFTYNSYAASPVHRFYQMWQQLDCSADRSTRRQSVRLQRAASFPGSRSPWAPAPTASRNPPTSAPSTRPDVTTTGEGSTSMGFYNMQKGDAPYFKHLADEYSMSDNFHQSVNGGTGANHIMLGHGDMIYFTDGKGHRGSSPAQCDRGPRHRQRWRGR